MTKVKEDVIRLIKEMPDERVYYILKIVEGVHELYSVNDMNEKEKAFADLEKLRRSVPHLDYDKELEYSREERYGHADFS